MSGKINAPFTKDQQRALNFWQERYDVHPFTCPNEGNSLVAVEDGWHCPSCSYTQQWAHDFMVWEVKDG